VLFAGVLIWWADAFADQRWRLATRRGPRKAWADIQGDEVTLHNVRKLRLPDRYRLHPALGDADRATLADHWHRSRPSITGGSPWIAHPIASFQFADAPPLCFSIETRKKLGQTYSTIGGLYRQFELIYIVGR